MGFTFNQFLIAADEPLLFHTGPRAMFPFVAEAVAKVMPVDRLRWITFGHVEADESGSMNMWLAAAPQAEVAHGAIGCMVSLNDLCDRPPSRSPTVKCSTSAASACGTSTLRTCRTPGKRDMLYEETTGTLLCGDLFTHLGNGPALTTTTRRPGDGGRGDFPLILIESGHGGRHAPVSAISRRTRSR